MSLNVVTCMDRINEVRAAASDYRSAYLLRMRLQRMVIAIHSLVGRSGCFVARDEQTGLLVARDGLDAPHLTELVSICNRLLLESRELSKRSAALDERWEEGWGALRGELNRLEELLTQPEAASLLTG